MLTEEQRLGRNAYMREWKKKNKAKVNQYNAGWRDKNREKYLEINLRSLRKARKGEPERFARYAKAHREKHPDKVRDGYLKWYAANGKASGQRRLKKKVEADPFYYLLSHARRRARDRNLEFNLTKDDVAVPETCPVLGIRLKKGAHGFVGSSPSVDRIDPSMGYIRGNVAVISWRANRLKADASLDELKRLVAYVESQGKG